MAQQYSWPSSSSVTLTGSTNGAPIPNDSVVVGGETDSGNVTPFRFQDDGDLKVAITGSVLPDGAATEAKQDAIIADIDSTNTKLDTANTSLSAIETSSGNIDTSTSSINTVISARLSGALVPTAFDEVDLTYVTAGNGIGQVETATYKLSAVTVKTLNFTYDANDQLSTVIAS